MGPDKEANPSFSANPGAQAEPETRALDITIQTVPGSNAHPLVYNDAFWQTDSVGLRGTRLARAEESQQGLP